MGTCKTCKHAVFNEFWGEYKCDIYNRVIYAGVGKDLPCTLYKKGEVKDSKVNENYPNKED